MADGRVREHSLEVALKQRRSRSKEQRAQADRAKNPEPLRSAGQHGPEPREQEYASLDHRR
jgi:hypothetical protein